MLQNLVHLPLGYVSLGDICFKVKRPWSLSARRISEQKLANGGAYSRKRSRSGLLTNLEPLDFQQPRRRNARGCAASLHLGGIFARGLSVARRFSRDTTDTVEEARAVWKFQNWNKP